MYALGIDTSNYKTSAALVASDGEIICNIQRYLDVKKGERGLRQSYALFQHVNRLPDILSEVFAIAREKGESIGCVSVSSRPRPKEDSYMPVFNAGVSAGKTAAAALDVPYFEFSHQEGHIEAVKNYLPVGDKSRFVAFHFSGGTTEALLVHDGNIEIVGGSRDISYGQVLDRTGVAMGMNFPCGAEMDRLVTDFVNSGGGTDNSVLPRIRTEDGYINLSGIETKASRIIGDVTDEHLAAILFERIGRSMADMTAQIADKFNICDFIFAGGVSASKYIRDYLNREVKNVNIYFGDPALSTDNAVGTALLGGKKIWL